MCFLLRSAALCCGIPLCGGSGGAHGIFADAEDRFAVDLQRGRAVEADSDFIPAQNFDHLSIINSLADIPSALFGGPPIEAIISGTAGAPWPVACGVVFMLVTGILVLLGLVGRLGKYLPAQSISGFLLIIGLVITFVPNLSTVAASDGSVSGFVALGVTAWSKNPFLGMVAGVLVRYFGMYFGLV